MKAKAPILYCDDGSEITLPTKLVICSTCDGNGKSSAYLGAITEGDRQPGGIWEDPDQFDEYMRGGYDRTCDECCGSGKVAIVDQSKMTKAQRSKYREQRRIDREIDAIEAAERRAGA